MKNISRLASTLALAALMLGCAPTVILHEEPLLRVNLPAKSGNRSNDQEVSVQFLGNTTLVIQDKVDRVIIDGFLSRPSLWSLLFGSIQSDRPVVDSVLCQAGIEEDDLNTRAIIPLHSHFDHVLDTRYIARKFSACIIADETAEKVTSGLEHVEICAPNNVKNQDYFSHGAFSISVSDTVHLDNGFVGSLLAPLGGTVTSSSNIDFSEPQKAKHYKEGRSLNVFINHEKSGVKLFVISGAFGAEDSESINKFQTANAVFISTPLFEKNNSPEFFKLMTRLLKKRALPDVGDSKKIIIPMHWDNLSRKIPVLSRCKNPSGETNDFERYSRDKLLRAPFVLRKAIRDANSLVSESSSQKTDLVWLTAYDQILFK